MRISFSKLEDCTDFRLVSDFPKSGVRFIDIMPALAKTDGISTILDQLLEQELVCFDSVFDVVLAPESRGFLIGTALADRCHTGFVPARKPGKLPPPVVEQIYDLEYSQDTLCIEESAIKPGQRVLIVDDVLATGGTAEALCKLVQKSGAEVVGILVVVDLQNLHGDLSVPVHSLYKVY